MKENAKPTIDPEIEEYNKAAVEEGRPTYGKMMETVNAFLSKSPGIRLGSLWGVPRTQLMEELYGVAKAIEEILEEDEGKSSLA